jgi:hypothetical protein
MTVRQLLAGYRGSRVHVLPNPGNGGDGLIQLGLRRLCAEFDLRVCELYSPQSARGELLLAPGAGNLSAAYYGVAERIDPYLNSFRTVCILPTSVQTEAPAVQRFLRELPHGALVFCREAVSLAQVRALLGDPASVHLDHDLAFEADLRPWARAGYGTLYAFRSDPESLGEPIPPGNFDVSGITGEWMAELLLDVVASYAVVHTDRAHVAIAAALLGRDTHLYATAYHKVRGIYEHSLAGRANVHFHDRHGTLAHPAAGRVDDPRHAVWRQRATALMDVRAAEGFA